MLNLHYFLLKFTVFVVGKLCLIYRKPMAVFSEFNLKRHFQTKHDNLGINLNETELGGKADDLVRSLKLEQFLRSNQNNMRPFNQF